MERVGQEMRIPLGHGDMVVSKKLLHFVDGRATVDEQAGVCVSKVVNAHLLHPQTPACTVPGKMKAGVGQLKPGIDEQIRLGLHRKVQLLRTGLDRKRCPDHTVTAVFHGSRSAIWLCIWPLTMAVRVADSHA